MNDPSHTCNGTGAQYLQAPNQRRKQKMRIVLAAALSAIIATQASLANPPPLPGGSPIPGGIPGPGGGRLLCTDLAIVGWNGTRSPASGPLAANEVALTYSVRNNGPLTYTAPDENKQWISLVMSTPTGPRVLAINVLPPGGSGPVSLVAGGTWNGHVRATLPPGVTRTAHPPVSLQLNYAAASAGWTPALDCNTSNNRTNVTLR
jgi:hypothetical protein